MLDLLLRRFGAANKYFQNLDRQVVRTYALHVGEHDYSRTLPGDNQEIGAGALLVAAVADGRDAAFCANAPAQRVVILGAVGGLEPRPHQVTRGPLHKLVVE